jgi:hypothetical protein
MNAGVAGVSARVELSRSQILRFRQSAGGLLTRLPHSGVSLRKAAWAGLQDSVPRAALLSLHARVQGIRSSDWEHEALVQLWGPRYNVYAVAADDLSVFSLGRLPINLQRLARAQQTAERLHRILNGGRMPFAQAGRALKVPHNSLRYAAPTGTVLLRWDGSRQPVVWTAPLPEMTPQEARLELLRRYLHILGPGTAVSFGKWAGVLPSEAKATFTALTSELLPARTPTGDGWMLARDEPAFHDAPKAEDQVRLLPSGDAYYLLWGAERELLMADAQQRAALWTTRVWPGALLVRGEIAGVWRRTGAEILIDAWKRFSRAEREMVESEAVALPLPELKREICVRWN